MAATLLDGLQAICRWAEEREAGVSAASAQLDVVAARLCDDGGCSPATDQSMESDKERRSVTQQLRDPFSAIKSRIGALEQQADIVARSAQPLVLANLLTASSKAAPLSRHDASYILEHCIDGDTIVLRPGCYHRPLVLQRPKVSVLHIRSGNSGGGTLGSENRALVPEVVIQSGGSDEKSGSSAPSVNVPCIAISSSWKNVELRGLAAEQMSTAPTAALHVDMHKRKLQSLDPAAAGPQLLPRNLTFVDCSFRSRSGVAVMLLLPEDAESAQSPSVVRFERCYFVPGRDSTCVRIRGNLGAVVTGVIQFQFVDCAFDSRGECFVSMECCGVACPSVNFTRCRFVCSEKGTSPWCVVQVQNPKNAQVAPIPIAFDSVNISEARLSVSLVGVSTGGRGGGGASAPHSATPAQQHVTVHVAASGDRVTENLETVQLL